VIGLGPEPADLRVLEVAALKSSVPRGRFQDTWVTEGLGVMIGLARELSSGAVVAPRRANGEVGGAMEAGVVLGVAGLDGASDSLLPGFVSMSELTLARRAKGSPSFFSPSSSEASSAGGGVSGRSLRGGGCHGAGLSAAGLRCWRWSTIGNRRPGEAASLLGSRSSGEECALGGVRERYPRGPPRPPR